MPISADTALIKFVDRELWAGKKVIKIPARLIENASKEALEEVRQICKLNCATIEIVA